jgi:hypothetical protein
LKDDPLLAARWMPDVMPQGNLSTVKYCVFTLDDRFGNGECFIRPAL